MEDIEAIKGKYCINIDNSVELQSVILTNDNREKLNEFLRETEHADKFIELGLAPINRILMYGASGTGKTYLTTALSNYLGYEFLCLDIAKTSESNLLTAIDEIFRVANQVGNAIIFLDECDAICRMRENLNSKDDSIIRQANNELFLQLDRMNPKCIFVGATNLYRNLDTAFVRRFNVKMEFPMPSADSFDSSINRFVGEKFNLICDMNNEIKEIVLDQLQFYDRLSYYDIKDWVERVEKEAILNDSVEISEEKIYRYLMDELRLDVYRDDNDKLYLYQHAKGKYS